MYIRYCSVVILVKYVFFVTFSVPIAQSGHKVGLILQLG